MSAPAHTIAVYCSARDGLAQPFIDAAHLLGRSLAERDTALVYGGGGRGLMGEIARAALAAGGRVTGVIPRSMVEREAALETVTEQIVIDTMHQRKQIMADRCDAYIAMPGGVGTMDEIFEAITWHQIGLHAKPMVFLDIEHYYTPLRAFLEHATDLGFVPMSTMDAIIFCRTVPEALDTLGL